MRNVVVTTLLMILGFLLMCFGLRYLNAQTETTNLLIERVSKQVVDGKDNVYQQSKDGNRRLFKEVELYAMIMGYRDYPIIIDGNEIEPKGEDFETYLTYISEGFYLKDYNYNSEHEIEKIIFTHTGT